MTEIINRQRATALFVVCLMGVVFFLDGGSGSRTPDRARPVALVPAEQPAQPAVVAAQVTEEGAVHQDMPVTSAPLDHPQPMSAPPPAPAVAAAPVPAISEGYRGTSGARPQDSHAAAQAALGEDLAAQMR